LTIAGRVLREALQAMDDMARDDNAHHSAATRQKRSRNQERAAAQQAAHTVIAGLQNQAINWRGSEEGIRGIIDAIAIAGGTQALVELFRSPGKSHTHDLSILHDSSRVALYEALPLCALEDSDWISDRQCVGKQLSEVDKWRCRIRIRRRNEAGVASHLQASQSLWSIIGKESEPELWLRAAVAMGKMDEKHGLLLKSVLDSIEAEHKSHAAFQRGHLFRVMLPYLAMQTRASDSDSAMDARIRRTTRDEHERLHRLLAFRFPEFELDASFSWTEFTVKLGLCAPRQTALSLGNQWIGFNIYIEICDQARAWIPYFGAPGYEIIIRNEFLAEITVLKKRFTLLRAYLGQEGGPPTEAAVARRSLSAAQRFVPTESGPHKEPDSNRLFVVLFSSALCCLISLFLI